MNNLKISSLIILTIIFLLCSILPAENNEELFNKTIELAIKAIQSQDWQKTAEYGKKLTELKPDYIWGIYYYGLGLSYTGKLKQGEEQLKKVLEMDKDHFWGNYILFFNYILQNKKDISAQAERVNKLITKELIKSYPFEIRSFYQNYADHLQKQGTSRQARAILKKGIKLFPKDPMLHSQYAFTYFRKDMKKWKRLSRESLKLVPKEKQNAINTYQVPLRGDNIKIHQGNNGGISHEGLLNAYSWDFLIIDEKGNYYKDAHIKENYYIYDQPVYAALDGKVTLVMDTYPDTEPLKNDPDAEVNIIIIQHAYDESSLYIHLKQNSGLVKVGDTVKKGQKIARVGASGRYVDIPHLHFQINRNGLSVKTKLTGFKVLRNKERIDPGAYTPQQDDILNSTWE